MRVDLKTQIFTIIVILSNVLGNFALSWGMKHNAPALESSPLNFIRVIFSPWVLLGVSLLIIWLLTRMTLLSWADLSYVLPVTSVGYVLTAVIAKFFFDEKITAERWLGTLCIVAGMILVGSTPPRTAQQRTD
ncbi:MAG: EamA family transporter [Acidobacteriaceae bacterium]|nr:EamA family transporter [Acidobacteriaceae bacterium]